MSDYSPVSAPYLRKNKSVRRTMLLVMAALTPATLYGFYLYGWPAIMLFVITLGSAMVFEIAGLWLTQRPISTFALDGSAMLTAWLLAVSLPPWAPWWIAVVGSGVAIVIGKQVYGGLGQNVFNPAMVARVALLISFPLEMTMFVEPRPMFSANAPGLIESLGITFGAGAGAIDGVAGATILDSIKNGVAQGTSVQTIMEGRYQPLEWILGNNSGSLAEGPDILLLAGGIVLIFMRVIRWHIPVSMLLSVFVMATFFNFLDGNKYPDAMIHLFNGTTMLAAFYIATDPVTSPMSPKGQICFGIGLGVLVYVIRTWTQYPEGMSFAILLMNAVTPLIDRYLRPRIFGRTRSGDPLT